MSEESKWNEFQQQLAKRRMKHDRNLPEDCEGCAAGMRWQTVEYIALLDLLQPGMNEFSVADACRKLNRPAQGILSKMRQLHLIWNRDVGIRGGCRAMNYAADFMYGSHFAKLDQFIQDILFEKGWREGLHGRMIAPEWWSRTVIDFDINHRRR